MIFDLAEPSEKSRAGTIAPSCPPIRHRIGFILPALCASHIVHLHNNKITQLPEKMNEGVVSKETVVLRRWGSSIQKFGFINGVDNVKWPPYRDSKS